MVFLPTFLFAACAYECPNGGKQSGDICTYANAVDSGTGLDTSDTDTGSPCIPFIAVQWDSEGITVQVEDCESESGANFGMAAAAKNQNLDDAGYFGEDCLTGICHPLVDDAGRLVTVDTEDEVEAGATTFISEADQDRLTYVVRAASGACFTTGLDVAYYADCTALEGE